MGYSPWGCKESDVTEHASTTDKFSSSLILSDFALYILGGSVYMCVYIHTYIQIHTSMYIHIKYIYIKKQRYYSANKGPSS